MAVDAAGNRSAEGRETYRVDSSPPVSTPTPGPGFFADTIDVALSCDDAGGSGCVAIHYTLDDSVPTVLSPVYEAPLHLSATTRLRAAAVDAAGNLEPSLVWEYTRDDQPPQTLSSVAPGAYRPPITVALAGTAPLRRRPTPSTPSRRGWSPRRRRRAPARSSRTRSSSSPSTRRSSRKGSRIRERRPDGGRPGPRVGCVRRPGIHGARARR